MDDWTCHEQDYHVEEDSDCEDGASSAEEEDEQDEMLILQTNDGKDILKEKQEEDSSVIQLSESVPAENLLYNEDIDKDNEKWMHQKRMKHKDESKEGKKIRSDAMLSCPACMITVCVDCQRHDLYKTQFRAMFVMNCHVITDQLLHYEHKNKSKKRRKKEGPGKLIEYKPDIDNLETNDPDTAKLETNQTDGSIPKTKKVKEVKNIELYNPVKCTQCETEIAVFDRDEIYHFFNVLESIA